MCARTLILYLTHAPLRFRPPAMQRTVVELPLDLYHRKSRQYSIVKNGVIVRRPKQNYFESIVEIHCTLDEAKGLLDKGLVSAFV